MRILLINGPNLNLLGTREPGIYGTLTLDDIVARVKARAEQLGVEVADFQSNSEGKIVEFIQREAPNADGAIINAAALTHYSLALHEVINATGLKVIEVHISNIHAREEFRHHSVIAGIAIGQVAGLGWRGYIAALDAIVGILQEKQL